MAVKEIFEISSNVWKNCPCGKMPRGDLHNMDITDQVNHMLQQHGYELLHVGQKTVEDSNGKPWQVTVAVLGKG